MVRQITVAYWVIEFQVLGSADWREATNMELRPHFTTKYRGVPQD